MATVIDARGLFCFQPVIKVKQALERGVMECMVLVDNEAAMENVIRYVEYVGG